ncbi:MAG: transcriptional regulator [Thermoplasmatota archaeon]
MLDPVVHQETRLRILACLSRNREMSFSRLCEALSLTPGNLSSHAARLTEAGLIEARHALAGVSFEQRYHLTPKGVEAFRTYLGQLAALLAGNEGQPKDPGHVGGVEATSPGGPAVDAS